MLSGRITLGFLALTAAAALGVAGCGSSGREEPPAASPGVIRLGALMPMTGDNAPSAENIIPALQMAADEANAAGGVLGRRVEVVTSDDACDPQTAVNQANDMVRKDITVSVGGYCSSATAPTLKIFHSAGVPMIIPAANSTDLIAPGYSSVFLLAGTTELEAERAVAWMPRLGAHKIVLVHDGTNFSESVANYTVTAAGKPGSQVRVVSEMQLSQGARSYGGVAARIVAAGGDLVFYTGYNAEAAKLIRDLRATGYRGKIALSDGGINPALFREVDPSVLEGIYGITVPLPQFEPGVADWSARFRALTGQDPGPFTMQAYDAVRLAVNAIQRAGTVDHDAVRKALATTGPGDIHLLSGPSGFNPDGTQKATRFILLRIHDGTLVRDGLSSS